MQPSYMFTDKEHRGPFEFSEETGGLSVGVESVENIAQRVDANDNDLLLGTSEEEEIRGPSPDGSAYSAPAYDAASISLTSSHTQSEPVISNSSLPTYSAQSSLAIDDLLGLSLSSSTTSVPSPPFLKLNAKAVIDPGTFQRKWGQLPIALTQECSISPQGATALTSPQVLLRHMQGQSIHCIASGGQAPNFKFFFFAQNAEASASFFLVECIINTSSSKVQIKVKADDQSTSDAFWNLFQSALSRFGSP
ncbi:hypothetical protein Syun_011959 [Stephania yunnanensis]|uniref:Beta-adaptin appendage C-terminal subdomain domain-containing protein n=1 Tax=Stephania yunnanensis TaxID=152371 RepID=A0AAP0JZA6_9MAGN